ncbi:MAG: iron ABC transporter permease [Butyricicoccus pullicaecorum]|nr:iron ABC transporter permease [Butyricicoccus pullicaecorum]MDO4668209.1 iron ABC transporter permease [Butyricicoccus pullicaecorum]
MERDVQIIGTKAIRRRLLLLLVIFFCCFLASFAVGLYGVPVSEVIRIFFSKLIEIKPSWDSAMEVVVINVRFPRILAAGMIGAALAVSGSVYQGMFHNPMVSPDVLGTSAGAGFGAALGILMGAGYLGTTAMSFGFGLLSVILVYLVSARYRNDMSMGLILAGIMVGSLASAATSFLKLVADPTEQLPAITYWLMGSLASIQKQELVFLIPVILIGMLPLFLLRWHLNTATLSDAEAIALGVNIRALRRWIIICATLMTAVSVSVSGMIGWVGLVIPHFARKYAGNDFRYQLPAAALMGGSFLILVDDLARILSTSEVPIGILTAFVGAPFFLYLLIHGGKRCD